MTQPKKLSLSLLFCAIALQAAYASTFKVVYKFTGASGSNPASNLIQDAAGNFYGTTRTGGAYNYGTVFKLSPAGVETVLYSFTGRDDAYPQDGLIFDSAGNLYGTAFGDTGGNGSLGEVFKLSPAGVETALWYFRTNGFEQPYGIHPNGGLVLGANGLLYGTTTLAWQRRGGTVSGSVFQVDTSGNNGKLLYIFNYGYDGQSPYAGLIMDSQGYLYGTTAEGGTGTGCGYQQEFGCGVVFKMSPSGQEQVLYSFSGVNDGQTPMGGLVMDSSGNLYGTTSAGGAYGGGTAFKLTQSGEITVLHSFGATGDGSGPTASLIMDSQGNLFGTTVHSGEGSKGVYNGSVFEIQADGTYTVLHDCTLHGGANDLHGSVFEDVHGNLWGTSAHGGLGCTGTGCGTVFELLP